MASVTINDTQGLVVNKDGSGLTVQSPLSVANLPTTPVSPKTAITTLVSPGVYTMTAGGNSGFVMPLASSVPGGIFVVRNGDAYANILTGSQEAQGTKVFKGFVSGTMMAQEEGSKISLPNIVGASVALISDGKSFLVLASSGSLSFSGT